MISFPSEFTFFCAKKWIEIMSYTILCLSFDLSNKRTRIQISFGVNWWNWFSNESYMWKTKLAFVEELNFPTTLLSLAPAHWESTRPRVNHSPFKCPLITTTFNVIYVTGIALGGWPKNIEQGFLYSVCTITIHANAQIQVKNFQPTCRYTLVLVALLQFTSRPFFIEFKSHSPLGHVSPGE